MIRFRLPVVVKTMLVFSLLVSFARNECVLADGIVPNYPKANNTDLTSNPRNRSCNCRRGPRHHADSQDRTIEFSTSQPQSVDQSFQIEAYLYVGNKARDAGKYEEALSHYMEVTTIDRGEWRGYYGWGNVLLDLSLLAADKQKSGETFRNDAIAKFQEAVKLSQPEVGRDNARNVEIAELYSDLAQAYIRKSDYDSAQVWVTKALQLNPNSASAIRRQGSIYLSRYLSPGNPSRGDESLVDNAMTEFGKSLRKEGDNPFTHRALGAANVQKFQRHPEQAGFLTKAISEFNEAVRLKRDFVAVYHDLGLLNFELGVRLRDIEKFKAAIDPYKKVLALNPLHRMARVNLTLSYCKTLDRTNAQREYDQLVKDYPQAATEMATEMRRCEVSRR